MVTRGALSAVFALSPRALSRRGRRGCWYRVSRFVMRRPATVLIGTLVPLLLVGASFLRADFALPGYRRLPEDLAPPPLAEPASEAG